MSPVNALRLINLLQVWSVWLFQTAAFVLGSQGKSACEPFKSRLSVPHTFLVLLDISQFLKPDTLGAALCQAGPKDWGSWCGAQAPHFLGMHFLFMRFLLIVVRCSVGGVWGETTPLHLLRLDVVLFPLLWRSCSAGFLVFFLWCGRRWVQDLSTLPSLELTILYPMSQKRVCVEYVCIIGITVVKTFFGMSSTHQQQVYFDMIFYLKWFQLVLVIATSTFRQFCYI